jgi:hypothetical protein
MSIVHSSSQLWGSASWDNGSARISAGFVFLVCSVWYLVDDIFSRNCWLETVQAAYLCWMFQVSTRVFLRGSPLGFLIMNAFISKARCLDSGSWTFRCNKQLNVCGFLYASACCKTDQSHKTGLRSALHPGNADMPVWRREETIPMCSNKLNCAV